MHCQFSQKIREKTFRISIAMLQLAATGGQRCGAWRFAPCALRRFAPIEVLYWSLQPTQVGTTRARCYNPRKSQSLAALLRREAPGATPLPPVACHVTLQLKFGTLFFCSSLFLLFYKQFFVRELAVHEGTKYTNAVTFLEYCGFESI